MNIFLIEDEPPILREISSLINSFQEDFTIIGTASDGAKALEFLARCGDEIDVIISDIQIPVINGLDVIKTVSENHPEILCIILTGYSRFEYAQRALQYGVFDYLLKPIDEAALHSQLKNAYTRKCLDSFSSSSRVSHSDTADRPKLNHTPTTYQLALLCLGPFPLQTTISHTTPDSLWQQCDLPAYLLDHLPAGSDYWVIEGKSLSEKLILFSFPAVSEIAGRKRIEALFTPMLTDRETLTVVVETQFQGIQSVAAAAEELRTFLSRRVALEKSQLLFYPPASETDATEDYCSIYARHSKLAGLFSEKKRSLFKTELKHYVGSLKQLLPPQQALAALLYELINSCLSAAGLPNIDIYTCAADVILLSPNYQTLYMNLASIFDSYFETLLKNTGYADSREDILIKIDAYIKASFSEPIATSQIAERFGFTPAYLSKIFREYKNQTISDYIVQLRMEKAKKLLLEDSSFKIKDVAAYVGYDDSLYFSKVFKKLTGMSPKQFVAVKN